MKAEYKEGKEARENFERLATELFKVPKSAVSPPSKEKRQSKKTASRTKSGKDKA
jgi:hypothetical protein